ncbi:Holliday junction DNA helicase subunit RuvA [Thiogranum longum]|uniref:Holliday junction branch migration complex subunit RuvA n=1 Tax=Thiogranum longum TaxID=1537524 RepID=A0A4R1HJG8_9GAMM|nr:Holliday junction branch migration protein RuvA [Thiogranum longum]TCK17362.1 Holliday junction DNA helicase subunit RuvA [Thiogranum longum]
MIGYLHGVLRDKQPPSLLIEVQGVGYEIEAPMTTFYDLPAVGEPVRLYTHLAVREDAHTLYGFSKLSDRTLFRTLIKVNGVGAKMALTILSGMEASLFAGCVQAGDTAALVKLPGVGKKTAERLVVEMRDRLADWDTSGVGVAGGKQPLADVLNPVEEAVSALVALGYKPADASRMVRAVDVDDLGTEAIIRSALQSMVK